MSLKKKEQEQSDVAERIPRGKNRIPYKLNVGEEIHGFKVQEIEKIDFFNITAYKLEHVKTGAKFLHLDTQDMDNVFAVLFRTPPDDHTGKPHILEHLATCGSKKYPVRDPFFNMLKRSLNTYMNAWTGSDFTMYPFSTQNSKDFNNLLSVYLDMAFFPKLDYLDFRQEGHRLEFKEWNDPSSQLEYKGVVFNEMKGAMSNPDDAFIHKINENLFKDSQYRFNSGGDPKYITSLEYKDLVEFHKKYYHPSNSTFLSYGDLDFTNHLKFIETEVLSSFQRKNDIPSEILKENRFELPLAKEFRFMPDLMSEPENQVKLGISFLCNQLSDDPYEGFCMMILSNLMFEGPNAPFYKNIIEGGIAPNFCPGTGYDYTTRESTFTMGVQGIKLEEVKKCEKALFDTLKQIADKGIEERFFDTILHQYEFNAKKTKSNFGLMALSHVVPYCLHGGDPLSIFKINEFSQRIRDDFKKGNLFQDLVKKHLLKNNHQLKLVMIPDPEIGPKEEKEEQDRLSALQKVLSKEEQESIIQEAYQLKQHQERLQDHTVLPSLQLSDIQRDIEHIDKSIKPVGNLVV